MVVQGKPHLLFLLSLLLVAKAEASPLLLPRQALSWWKQRTTFRRDTKISKKQAPLALTRPPFTVISKIAHGGAVTNEEELAETKASPPPLPEALNLTVHEELLTKEECDAIVRLARPFLQQSKVGRPPKVEPSLRISLSCKLPRLPVPELWSVEHKLAKAANVPVERGEDLQVGGYPAGHYYGMHCDERQGGRPNGGGRLATALAYLNDLDPAQVSGGHTVFSGLVFDLQGEPDFPRGDIRVRELKRICNCNDTTATRVAPKQGRVITFRNLEPALDGKGDAGSGAWRFIPESTHGACPIVNVTTNPTGPGAAKMVVQQWFGLPSEVNVARHPNLVAHLGLGVADGYKVDPMADLASPNGRPLATKISNSTHVTTGVPSLIPNIGATKLQGWCAELKSSGQSVIGNDRGIAAAIWVNKGRPDGGEERASGGVVQRLFRVGPHELCVDEKGQVSWAVGTKTADATGIRLVPDQWYHLALVVRPANDMEATNLNAELYLSVPGQMPRKPVNMELSGVNANEMLTKGVSVGGCREGHEGQVHLTVTDFYALNADMTGKGHSFAFALTFYDPGQGF